MLVEATHAGCRSFSLLICTYLHDILAVHLFNAGLPCMASSRAIARTQPVASVIHRPQATMWSCPLSFRLWEPAICSPESGSGVVQGWSGSGTGMERYGTVWNGVWNETAHSSTAATTQRIFINHAARLYQNWQIGARVDCQLAGSWRAHLYHQTAGSNCKWCWRKPATGWEGGRVTSNPFLDCQLAAAKRIPTITQQSR